MFRIEEKCSYACERLVRLHYEPRDQKSTYVMNNIERAGPSWCFDGEEVSCTFGKDIHVDLEKGRKGDYLHVVSVGTSLGHGFEVALECSFDIGFGRLLNTIDRSRICSSILPLWISTETTSWMDNNEGLVLLRI